MHLWRERISRLSKSQPKRTAAYAILGAAIKLRHDPHSSGPLPSVLQQPGPCMIPEQIGVSYVGLQHVHRLVRRQVPYLEHGSTAARRAGQETGPRSALRIARR